MKFGHPRVYNPWPSSELNDLGALSNELINQIDDYVHRANLLIKEQRIVAAQMRDCHLTIPEQIARMDALDEMGAPQ
jgi:hypothetical protein